ncbi:MAG: diaminopimelate decarboxylase [Candidatus Latescibacterota bacterium]
MERLSLLSEEQVRAVQARFGTPAFVYSQAALEEQARQALAFPSPFGLTVRYAMKACPTGAIVRLFSGLGLHVDASSGQEARRALRAGVPPAHVQLTSQQLPDDLEALVEGGILFTATSLRQTVVFGQRYPGRRICLRVNPGLGSGHTNRTNTGGPAASFGIWHEHLDEALQAAASHGLRISGLHSHIGSGTDPAVWQHCARLTLGIAASLPQVERVSLGGGFKVGRMSCETGTDLQAAGRPVAAELEEFARCHGRRLQLEIEPGTFLVANAGVLVSTVIDLADTGAGGYRFVKVDTGMTEMLRPSLYGAQHPIVVVPCSPQPRPQAEFVVVGHCCESGDILTPEPGNPEGLAPRPLAEPQIGDALVIGGAGAYCAGMSARNYNSFPEAAEVLLGRDGRMHLIRRRQTLEQMVANEVLPEVLR